MSTFVHFIGAIALLFILVLVGDRMIARIRGWIEHQRRNRLAKKYGFVEWRKR